MQRIRRPAGAVYRPRYALRVGNYQKMSDCHDNPGGSCCDADVRQGLTHGTFAFPVRNVGRGAALIEHVAFLLTV